MESWKFSLFCFNFIRDGCVLGTVTIAQTGSFLLSVFTFLPGGRHLLSIQQTL